MTRLAITAELQKLAHLLEEDVSQLTFLSQQSATDLRQFREHLAEALFAVHAPRFRLLANLSGMLPATITAKIAHKALGAYLSGRVTGELPTKRAVAVASKLPLGFLADVALSIDPRRAGDVIRAMPLDTIKAVASRLVSQREYVTMGRFVGAVTETAVFAVMEQLTDSDLLHISFYVEDNSRLDHIISRLSDERIRGMMHTATEHQLWPEALALVQVVSDKQKGRLGNLVANEDDALLDSLVHVAHDQALWPEVLTAVAGMTASNQQNIVNLPSVTQDAVLADLLNAITAHHLWKLALPLVTKMSDERQNFVINLPAASEPAALEAMLAATYENNLWSAVIPLIGRMNEATQQKLFQLPDAVDLNTLIKTTNSTPPT